jgi:ankyrin repeat protein
MEAAEKDYWCLHFKKDFDHCQLTFAAFTGDLGVIKRLLAQGINLNEYSDIVGPPLRAAIIGGNLEAAKLLIKLGAIINFASGELGLRPNPILEAACFHSHACYLELLIEHGLSPCAERNSYQYAREIYYSARLGKKDIVSTLMNHYSDQDHGSRQTSLNAALLGAIHGHEEDLAMTMLDQGADFMAEQFSMEPDLDGYDSPFRAACYTNNKVLIQRFLDNHANIIQEDESPRSLAYAVRAGHIDIVRKLLDLGVEVNPEVTRYGSPLMRACWIGSLEMSQLLISHGAKVEEGAPSSLYDSSYTNLTAAVYRGHTQIVKLLLELGADPNARPVIDRSPESWYNSQRGPTPLEYACVRGHKDIVELLINAGADVNKSRRARLWVTRAPVILAHQAGHNDIVQMLLKNGARYEDLASAQSVESYIELPYADENPFYGS